MSPDNQVALMSDEGVAALGGNSGLFLKTTLSLRPVAPPDPGWMNRFGARDSDHSQQQDASHPESVPCTNR